MTTRRKALVTIAAGSASAAVASAMPSTNGAMHDTEAEKPEKTRPQEKPPVYFHERNFETITRLVDMIIPRTDTPGAADVGVAYRVDRAVSSNPRLQREFEAGLKYLNSDAQKQQAQDFLSLDQARQAAALKAASEAVGTEPGKFFASLKKLTLEWYYRSEAGLAQELGYKGNSYRTSFTGCTHPEHWPA
jgi:hypothetical protein